ncbi:MAG TPA: acylglycerol kinase family protein, partial [Bradyrhizobium sp.]|nr:acylglycerol kinase family protein [Bradyrhizobium sp.]
MPASGGAARRWFAIINPASGAMRSRAFREFWVPEIKRRAVTVFSEGPQHATQLASEARDYHGIVAVGGDGTALEVLAGIDRQNQCFAVLPAGRGNSLARDLGVASMERGTEALGSGRARRIDLIELKLTHVDQTTTRALAASTVAVGYAVAVAQRAGDFAATGRQAYTVATAFVRPVNVDISIGYGEKDATP